MKIPPIKQALSSVANIFHIKNDRIRNIALDVLKVLGITLAGAVMGGLTLATAGTVWIVVGAALGAGTAIASYGLGRGFVHLQKNRAFPAHRFRKEKPIDPNSYFTQKKDKKLDGVIEKNIQPLPEYAEWKKLRGNKNDRQAKRIFRKVLRSHNSLGQAHGLATTAAKKPIPAKLDATELFTSHILNLMRADLGVQGQALDEPLNKIPAHEFHKDDPLDTDTYFTPRKEKQFDDVIKTRIKPLPEYTAWKNLKGHKSDRQARIIFRKAILNQCALGQAYATGAEGAKPADERSLSKFNDEALLTKEILQIMANDLGEKGQTLRDQIHEIPGTVRKKTILFKKDAFPKRTEFFKDFQIPVMGLATLTNGDLQHTIFFQMDDKGGRFYDGSHRLAGFHDQFPSQEEFLDLFYRHIRAGMLGKKILRPQYNAVEIELFRIQ